MLLHEMALGIEYSSLSLLHLARGALSAFVLSTSHWVLMAVGISSSGVIAWAWGPSFHTDSEGQGSVE